MTDARRKRLYTLLAVANRELTERRAGWCDEDYRMILAQCGAQEIDGTPSATTMTVAQMEQALIRFKQLGFKVRHNGSGGWRQARINKLNALWCLLADRDLVRNRSQQAMEQFCRRYVAGFTRLQWATSEQLNQAIEMLKKWANRSVNKGNQDGSQG